MILPITLTLAGAAAILHIWLAARVSRHRRLLKIGVGDVLFQGSIGRTDFPMGNHQDLIDAITGRLWPLGDDTAFVPGHGPMSTFGQERRTNPFVADRVLARA